MSTLIYWKWKTGQSLARFCDALWEKYDICDDHDAPESFDGYTRIIPSPGVPSSHAIYHSGKIVSELDFLLPYVPKDFQIHAVTGTDGKSTTSWLLYQFLRGGFPEDVPVYIGGNFGTPFADVLFEIREKKEKSGHIVLEVSSFMAYRLSTFRIDNTILTNLHPDHLDWHSDVHEYYQSKFTLLGRTRSLILYPESIIRDLPEISDIPLQRIVLPEHISLENNLLPLSDEVFLDISDSQLYGAHNLANIFFAAQLAFHLGISAKQLSTILAHVPPLSHRLQKISEKSGRIWIDDSKSTTAQSLFAALRSFSPQKVYLIAGGKNKGDTFEWLAQILQEHSQGCAVLGETSHVFLQACHDVFIPCVHVSNMKEAVDNAFSQTKEGDIILLSPGCSSLDMFQNYEDRAEQFVLAIDGLE